MICGTFWPNFSGAATGLPGGYPMPPDARAPEALMGSATGAERVNGYRDQPETTAATPEIQDLAVRRFIRRYRWGRPLAQLVAELAYGRAAT